VCGRRADEVEDVDRAAELVRGGVCELVEFLEHGPARAVPSDAAARRGKLDLDLSTKSRGSDIGAEPGAPLS
jgi:hypothetical protein